MSGSADTSRVVSIRPPSREGNDRLWHREVVLHELDFVTTPPSPIRMALIATICAVFAGALLIACLLKIDIYAVAEARLRPAGGSRTVEPMAPGKVSAIRVANGSEVHKGDLLLELDPTDPATERATHAERYDELSAEIARRTALNAAVSTGKLNSDPPIAFEADTRSELQIRERQVLKAELASLRSQLQALDARIAENTTRKNAALGTIAQQERLVAAMQKRYDAIRSLPNAEAASKLKIIEAEQSLAAASTDLAESKAQAQNAEAAIRTCLTEKQHAVSLLTASNMQALADAQARRNEIAQGLAKAPARPGYIRVVAPIDGVVQDVAVTNVGQVVSAGQHLLTIVPNDSRLEIQALVSNRDIGFVEVGQHAVLKLDAFPFTRYGTLSSEVVRISPDSIDSAQALSLTTASAHDIRAMPVGPAQNLVYPVTAAMDRSTMSVDGRKIPLLPGMTGRLEIRTGERRAIEYLLSPLIEVISEAGHER